MSLYMQYGCGFFTAEHWLNFDASPTLRFERIPILGRAYTKNGRRFPANATFGDIVKGLPLATDSCDGIYCAHILEHLARDDCELALRNTFTYLKPGGIFRLVVPDLEYLAKSYLASPSSESAHRFMHEACLGVAHRSRGIGALMRTMFGHSAHLWMWDERSTVELLRTVGFEERRRAYFGDCEDPKFKEVEVSDRFLNCLGIQCRKPRPQ